MSETLQTLTKQLNHPDLNVRSNAVLGIATLNDVDTLDILLNALIDEPDLLVREDITWALVRIGERTVPPLIDLLSDPNPSARHHAAHVLGKLHDPRAVDALVRALQDDSPVVVVKAAVALGQIGDERAIPGLVGLLGSDHRDVETTVNTILERFGDAAVSPLIRALDVEQWQVRVHAADALGIIEARDAVPVLVNLLDDENWQVRFAAVTALGGIGGAVAAEALEGMRPDPDPRVRDLLPKAIRQTRRAQRR